MIHDRVYLLVQLATAIDDAGDVWQEILSEVQKYPEYDFFRVVVLFHAGRVDDARNRAREWYGFDDDQFTEMTSSW
jgi:hypothetical protein